MKIRNDFVTNSSTSSFCIVGVQAGFTQTPESEETTDISTLATESKIECHCPFEGDYYLGLDISEQKDEETLKDFKIRVFQKLQDFGKKCEKNGITLNESYRDKPEIIQEAWDNH